MYELKNGSSRITCALHERIEDKSFIDALAKILNYVPEQLTQDIQALFDYRINGGAEERKHEK